MIGFPEALAFVLAREGGLVDDPADPGGRTNLGITQKTLDDWRHTHPEAPAKVDDLTPDLAAPIYHDRYWTSAGCDEIESPMNLVVFDTAVNMGPLRAVQWRSQAGDWQSYLWVRLGAYCDIVRGRPASLKFLSGWCRRLIQLHDACRRA